MIFVEWSLQNIVSIMLEMNIELSTSFYHFTPYPSQPSNKTNIQFPNWLNRWLIGHSTYTSFGLSLNDILQFINHTQIR